MPKRLPKPRQKRSDFCKDYELSMDSFKGKFTGNSYLMGNSMVSGFDLPCNQSIETRNRKLEVFKKFVVPTCHSLCTVARQRDDRNEELWIFTCGDFYIDFFRICMNMLYIYYIMELLCLISVQQFAAARTRLQSLASRDSQNLCSPSHLGGTSHDKSIPGHQPNGIPSTVSQDFGAPRRVFS